MMWAMCWAPGDGGLSGLPVDDVLAANRKAFFDSKPGKAILLVSDRATILCELQNAIDDKAQKRQGAKGKKHG